MKKIPFCWEVGYTKSAEELPEAFIPATVPGAVQLDYARANNWPPFYEGMHSEDYAWMEDVYWVYQTELSFSLEKNQRACLIFEAIDYQYEISVDGEILTAGEGMFHTVRCDVTRFAGEAHTLRVRIWPIPKSEEAPTRSQANHSCKSAICYGWDCQPRLVTSGLWGAASLQIENEGELTGLSVRTSLSDDLSRGEIRAEISGFGSASVCVRLLDGETVLQEQILSMTDGRADGTIVAEQPRLWQPAGYGEPFRYTLEAFPVGLPEQKLQKPVGLRRVRLVMNEGAWLLTEFPKSRSPVPITLEVNGRRIFGKGTNWVPPQVFPSEIREKQVNALLQLIADANMNLIRLWGGGILNPEFFYDTCDRLGLMVWQEFPLACNNYPDEPHYLSVLEQEARAYISRVRQHPCLALWCGGNELFNDWSGMTDQSHAIRLLNTLCYQEDRNTPFLMTAPLFGMGHGHYINVDDDTGREILTTLLHANQTAYSEFGSPSMSNMEVLRTMMTNEQIEDCSPENPLWLHHHGFKAWMEDTWVRIPEANYFFGSYSGVQDLIEKTQFIQAMCLRSYFEEIRRQWPHASIAMNWCFNEGCPTAANGSIVMWPAEPKPAYYTVKEALRPQMASLRVERQLWRSGEMFTGEIWMLNDGCEALQDLSIRVSYELADKKVSWGVLSPVGCEPQRHTRCGSFSFPIPTDYTGLFRIHLEVEGHPEMDSRYTYPCRAPKAAHIPGMLNM